MRDFELVDQNLRTALRFFGEATGKGEVRAIDGADAVYSGLDYGVFNIAMLSRPVHAAAGGLEGRVAECGRFYSPVTQAWSLWVCEDLLEPPVRRKARQSMADCGMKVISQPPGMLAPSLAAPNLLIPDIECRAVTNEAARDAFAAITSVCFDIPYRIAEAVYRNEQAWNGSYRGYVGFVRGVPVSIVALVAAAGVMGVYSLATLPEHRRHGYAEALLRQALGREAERAGVLPLVLQSTDTGYRLYRRLGFRDVTRYAVYLTK